MKNGGRGAHAGALAEYVDLLGGLVSSGQSPPQAVEVPAQDIPPAVRGLLDHREHMTSVLEDHYGAKVVLGVRRERQTGACYSRLIVLTLEGTNTVVELGVARIHLGALPNELHADVLAGSKPLGDILRDRAVLRTIEPRWFLRLPDAELTGRCWNVPVTNTLYGRVGVIHCGTEPAIELLEIVTAAPRSGGST